MYKSNQIDYKIDGNALHEFCSTVKNFYQQRKRSFAWRENITPYKILVSEIMLQQTQTARVVSKFSEWMRRFPTIFDLADASRQEVLCTWQGLGYNRRGLALHEASIKIVSGFDGIVPNDSAILESFYGIGPNTASSICTFAFNQPVVFIETNIRTVFLHHFFQQHEGLVSDKQILPLIEKTLDRSQARDWYYALMDYGTYLKQVLKADNKKSKHYAKQSNFIGSKRQIRGVIVKILSNGTSLSHEEICELVRIQLPNNVHNVDLIIQDLLDEQMIQSVDGLLKI